jgi:hypothetical protein
VEYQRNHKALTGDGLILGVESEMSSTSTFCLARGLEVLCSNSSNPLKGVRMNRKKFKPRLYKLSFLESLLRLTQFGRCWGILESHIILYKKYNELKSEVKGKNRCSLCQGTGKMPESFDVEKYYKEPYI